MDGDLKYFQKNLIVSFAIIFSCPVFFSCQSSDYSSNKNKSNDTISEDNTSILQEKIAKKKRKNTIYLTFDDGPCPGTKTVLSILQQEQVPATFFIVGMHVFASPAQHIIYENLKANKLAYLTNHSYTHAFRNNFKKFYRMPTEATNDFVRTNDSLHFNNHFIRTPGRNIWRTDAINFTDLRASKAAADTLYSKGFWAIGWDEEWHFNRKNKLLQTDTQMLVNINKALTSTFTKRQNNVVLLMHDRTFESAEDSAMLHRFIIALKKTDDYDFEIISNYPFAKSDTVGIAIDSPALKKK